MSDGLPQKHKITVLGDTSSLTLFDSTMCLDNNVFDKTLLKIIHVPEFLASDSLGPI